MALPIRTVILGSPASPTHKIDPLELADALAPVDSISGIDTELNSIDGRVTALEARDFLEPNPKSPVVAATTANITLSGEQTIDGVAVTTGNRVLVKDQGTANQNGIYVVASGSWTRATDMDANAEVPWATVFVEGGTANGGTGWIAAVSTVTLGSTSIPFVQIEDNGSFQGQIDDIENELFDVREVVSDFEIFGHPEVPGTTTGLAASAANFVFADPVVTSGYIKRFTLFADTPGTVEINTWSKSGDTFTKQNSVAIAVTSGLQTIEVNLPVTAGQRVGFISAISGIVAYEGAPSINDNGGWYAGGAYGSTSFVDSTVSTTGGRLYVNYEIWSFHARRIETIDDDLTSLTARVVEIEGRQVYSQTKNFVNPLSSQNQFNQYVIPGSGTPGPIAGDRYAVVGAFPVEAGKKYRLDLTNALTEWQIYQHPIAAIYFYDEETMSATNLISKHISGDGVVEIVGGRVATFTVPAGATHVGFTAYGATRSVTTAEFKQLLTAIYLVEGWDEKELTETAIEDVQHDVIVQRSGVYLYIRVPHRVGDDAVYRVNSDYDPGLVTNGVIDFDGIRLIPAVTAYDDTKTAFDASPVVLNGGGDASPPFKLNNMFLGGGHGIVSQKVTDTGHGKANVDVGSIYTDGASKQWVLTQIVDADNLIFTAVNTAASSTQWAIAGGITGSLTHTSGGTNTATVAPSATVQTQLWPTIQDYQYRAIMDDLTEIYEDGVYFCREFKLIEEYGIPNADAVLDYLVANVGSSDAPDYTDPTIQTQIEIQTTYTWDFTGVCEVNYTNVDVQDYIVNYHGGMQMQKMIADTGETLFLFVPRCTTGTLASGQDTATFSATVSVNAADFTDPSNPPDRFWQMLKRGTEKRHGFIMGYSKNKGVDRTNIATAFYTPNTSLKMYPQAVDAGMGATAVAGTLREVVGFFGPFDPNRDEDFNAKVLFRDAGKHSLYLQLPSGVTNKWVGLPSRMIGKPVSATFADGVTLKSTVVSSKGVLISSASGGELEILIG